MGRLTHSTKLIGEFVAFARANKAWWIIPILTMLGLVGVLLFASQAAAPFIYTLF